MRRRYINKIEVWSNGAEDDTVGGNLVTPTQISSSWCNIKTLPTDKLVAYGLDITQQAITIKTRFRNDLDYFQEGLFFKYKSIDWMPTRVYNKDLLNEELTIIATAI